MPDELSIQKDPLNEKIDGQEVNGYLLKNKNGMTVWMMDYGATVLSVQVPDKDGNIGEVTLGFKDFSNYTKNKTCEKK